ncbi:MAG TPA: nuclear transport factor 2 family protein [Myxococcota bacterium]|nr:nuclear transport factor 2 family protein [Myxococcota bacterium]
MSTRIEQLQRDVQFLKDRAAILDCIAAHARGCDRHDVALLSSTYHPDGVDEHGKMKIPGPEYAAWANGVHGATSRAHMHHVTTHTCTIDGDQAHAESYVLVALLSPDGKSATVMSGRYVDRLERRDGAWKLAVRRATVELAFSADASLLQSGFFKSQGYVRGTRDRDDLSYRRPLGIDTAAERW